ncbi:30S ribosomal protein S8 [Candidatus Sumerlaeota bacterium]|nr:30S ribosomal protein S8 [Candidatus Sumerlaeota bacterium]MBI3735144.1 30S ribosomal protein S8 [Candidatus Sumerlaeota bacterium]
MSISDPIGDMLTRIRNGAKAKLEAVRMPASQLKINLVKILREEGYIKYFKVVRAGSVKRNPKSGDSKEAKPLSYNLLIVYLKYGANGEQVINGIRRVSRPGLRRYVGYADIPRALGGMGIVVLSTSKGLMTGREARKQKLGGELLCSVW